MFKALSLNIVLAFQELLGNPLRTFLSLLGVTIGVFCIVCVRTVFDSLESNIQSNMASLGNDVLYIGKFPWMPEGKGEYAWWKYKARPVVSMEELKGIQQDIPTVGYSSISYSDESVTIAYDATKIDNSTVYAVSYDFNKLQAIDIARGRYFSLSEMEGSQSNAIVLGHKIAEELFGSVSPLDKEVKLYGRKFFVIGVMAEQGQTLTGFKFDDGLIISYNYYSQLFQLNANSGNGFSDPMLMLKVREGKSYSNMKNEVEGYLRAKRRIKPSEENNFSFNQLDGIQNRVEEIFGKINVGGLFIGLFSLIVGIFGVANIMFVSVKERTNIIGIKKAIGAKNSSVLMEFLVESIILCLLGGLLGLLLVYITTEIISANFDFPVEMSSGIVLFGLILSVIVGIISGFIPAYKASKLNPVTAIRS